MTVLLRGKLMQSESSKRMTSLLIVIYLVLGNFFVVFSSMIPYIAEAEPQLELNAGNITLQLSDIGRFHQTRVSTGIENIIPLNDYWQYFFIYQNNYGVNNVAALFPGLPIEDGDFEVIDGVDAPLGWEETGTTQKISGTFTETRVTSPDDFRIHQTAWTQTGAFWVVIEWKIENIYGSDLTGVKAGMRLCSNFENDDNEDDWDFWDATDSIYYYTDTDAVNQFFGFSSANVSYPIDHYYGIDGYNTSSWPNLPFQGADTAIYNAINSPNQTAALTAPDRKVGSVIDWDIGMIPNSKKATIAVVVAFGTSLPNLQDNISKAQAFYAFVTMAKPNLIITEIMDSGIDEYIEVYNNGEVTANTTDINISLDGGITNVTIGSWNSSSIPPSGYSVFRTGDDLINDEGGTVSIFYTPYNTLDDEIGFGQEGYPPDPPPNQSVARIYSGSMYSNKWNWDSSPTFGDGIGPDWSDEQNDVAGIEEFPLTRLNEVLFNPNSEDMFIEIISFLNPGNLNGTQIMCDSVYSLEDYLITDGNNYYTLYENSFPVDFDITPQGDNIYLFDKNGKLLDMVGWNSSHDQDKSVRRNFPGVGQYNGWNDQTTVSAGWSFNQTPNPYFELFITEIQDSPAGGEAIELYYRAEKNAKFNISSWRLAYNGVNVTIPMGTYVPGGGYLVFGDHPNASLPLGLSLNDEGGNISLFDEEGNLYRCVGYGTNGTAPDPLTGESIATYAKTYIDGLYLYEEKWNRDISPTIGVKNTVPPISLGSHLKLNEVLYNTNSKVGFIELIYDGNFVTYKMNDSKTYPFINASDGGIPLSFVDGDNGFKGVWMDFSFNFYGNYYNLIQIGINGYISFSSYPIRPDNLDFPLFDDDMHLVIAPIWDDLNLTASANGGIFYKTTGNSPNRIFTVTYYKIEHDSGPNYDYDGKYMTFEVNLYESDGKIVFQYEDLRPGSINLTNVDDLNNHTIGLNEGDGVRSAQHASISDMDDGLDIEFKPINEKDITGYKIVCDDEYIIGEGGKVVITFNDPYATLIESFYPVNFDMDVNADNVYLYDNQGRLLDMVGWSTPHSQDKSVNRVPEGSGTSDGYDDNTSILAGWVFDTEPTMHFKPPFFTEIRDSGPEQIEIYNPSISGVNLSAGKGWYLETKSVGIPVNLSSLGIILSGGYINITLGDGNLSDEGDEIKLYDEKDVLWSRIRYGTKGLAPDPLFDESTARYFGHAYTDNWTRDPTPTFNGGNEQNDVPAHNETPIVLLNEVMFNPDMIEHSFVELKLKSHEPLDVSGYKIVCDDVYVIPAGSVLDDIDPYFILLYEDAPYFFQNVTPTGDNIYLYTANDNLVDMVGWNSAHQKNKTVARVPEGIGQHRAGYDDPSSVAAGWMFNQTPTVPFILVGPDIMGYGFPGESITYNLTLKNKYTKTEILEISNQSLPNGWTVIVLDENGTLLTDSNGNGKPDVTLDPSNSTNITVLILIPNIFPMANLEITTIIIQGYYNPSFGDIAILESKLYPHLQLLKSASPNVVNLKGTGYNEIFTITLNVTGSGYGVATKAPQDVVFIVDRSGSMSSQDVDLAKEALLNYTYDMNIPDTGAVIYFDSSVVLMHNLTAKYDNLRTDINNIPGPGGATHMGEAMHVASSEIIRNGQDGHIHVEILLTDGGWNGAVNPIDEADFAAANDIVIYTVGLGPGADEALLINIANITGGMYFYAETASDLEDIYSLISGYVKEIAARDINTSDSIPMIVDILPPWINLIPNSFNIPPDHITIDANGNTTLEWNKSLIYIGESFIITFNCTSSRFGDMVLTNVIAESRANYTRWDNKTTEFLFPPCYVKVIGGIVPPNLYIETSGPGADNLLLRWDPPISPGIAKYYIYGSFTRTGFDFSSPWVDTSGMIANGMDPVDLKTEPLRTSWNITNASSYDELYFTIRAVDVNGNLSSNSRTVGKYSRSFEAGISAFALPLQPIETFTADDLIMDMGPNAIYIKWMNQTTHTWRMHNNGDGPLGTNNTNLYLGDGYVVLFSTQEYVTFVGMPGTMIKHREPGYPGFDPLSTAQSLTATIIGNDIRLNWTRPSGVMDGDYYVVYFSTSRDGFFGALNLTYWEVPGSPVMISGVTGSLTHTNALLVYDRLYYMVVTSNATEFGGSTYSIGVWTENFLSGYDTLGLPLKLYFGDKTADWYCDNIQNTVGINYFIYAEQRWSWHRINMPAGIYDTLIEIAEGYQISTSNFTKYTFIGH